MTRTHRHHIDSVVDYNHYYCCCYTVDTDYLAAFVDENFVEVLDNYFDDKVVDYCTTVVDCNYPADDNDRE